MTIDEMLIEKLKSKDDQAFENIYTCYCPQLISYACARLSSLEESRDLVHDVFVRLYERRSDIKIDVSIRTYLFAALKYKMIDHIRRSKHQDYYKEMMLSLDMETEEKVFDQMVYKNLNGIMDKEINRLPMRVRETFILSRRSHMSVSEIASQMNVSEQTVKNQLSTAIKKLRFILQRISIFVFTYLLVFISY